MNLKRNPNAGKFVLPDGYTNLGWQLHSGNSDEIRACCDRGHNRRDNPNHWREFDNSAFENRGTDIVHICDACKIVWHIDMSD